MPNNDEYEVGYKKPPLHTRIKPGERRNPHGRPKGSKNVHTILNRVMDSTHTATVNGKRRKVALTEAILLTQVKKAVEDGDTRAAQYLLDRKAAIDAARAPEAEAPVIASDLDLLEDYKRRILADEQARQQQEAPPKCAKKPKETRDE